jgi:hypothetical protein
VGSTSDETDFAGVIVHTIRGYNMRMVNEMADAYEKRGFSYDKILAACCGQYIVCKWVKDRQKRQKDKLYNMALYNVNKRARLH